MEEISVTKHYKLIQLIHVGKQHHVHLLFNQIKHLLYGLKIQILKF